MLQIRTRFTRTWWMCSNIALDMGFPKVLGLATILYSISIGYFLNSWPISYDPWSYVISIGQGCLVIHIVSTKFSKDISHLSSYFIILNDVVMELIPIMDSRIRSFFYLSLHIVWVPIRYKHSLSRGI